MKQLIVVAFAMLVGFNLLLAQAPKSEPQKLTLRVTSSGEKPVAFVASIFFKMEKAHVEQVVQSTPYEITVESNYVNATLLKTSGEGDLVVDLVKAKPVGDQPNLKASGSIIVVGTNDAEKGVYYQHTF